MNDTTAEFHSRFRVRIMKKTQEERLLMGCSMFDASKRIVKSSILNRSPNIRAHKMKTEIFLRFYGTDFQGKDKEKIIKFLNRREAKACSSQAMSTEK